MSWDFISELVIISVPQLGPEESREFGGGGLFKVLKKAEPAAARRVDGGERLKSDQTRTRAPLN